MSEMVVYFCRKTMMGQVPENILEEVRNTFTKFEIETCIDGTVVFKVPRKEKEIVSSFDKDVYNLLKEIKKENSVLAGKLARRTGF